MPDAAPPADWQRPPPTARQQRIDVAVGLALALAAVGSMFLSREAGYDTVAQRPSVAEEVAWCLAVTLPLCLRRRAPLVVLALVAGAFIGLQSRYVGETQLSSVCLFLALFTAGAWGRDRTLTRALRTVVVVVMFAWLAYSLSATAWSAAVEAEREPDAIGVIPEATAAMIYLTAINVLYFGAAWFFGDLAFAQARQHALLEERTVELARERDENARRAVLDERVRIARELHDVVAHHVSVMGVQAGAARLVLDTDQGATRRALAGIEASARSAVEEMRRLLGVLRSPDPQDPDLQGPDQKGPDQKGPDQQGPDSPKPPAPGLAALDDLLDGARRAGLRADLTVVGEPRPVPAGAGVTAYRVVQEALTNTVRHAAATRVDVRVRYLAAALEVEVVDDGRAAPGSAPAPAAAAGTGEPRIPGMGHVGMRERVALHDGELDLGPRPDGGYRVRARLPLLAAQQPAQQPVEQAVEQAAS